MKPYKIWLLPLIATAVIGVTLVYSALAAPDTDTGGSATEVARRFLLKKARRTSTMEYRIKSTPDR